MRDTAHPFRLPVEPRLHQPGADGRVVEEPEGEAAEIATAALHGPLDPLLQLLTRRSRTRAANSWASR